MIISISINKVKPKTAKISSLRPKTKLAPTSKKTKKAKNGLVKVFHGTRLSNLEKILSEGILLKSEKLHRLSRTRKRVNYVTTSYANAIDWAFLSAINYHFIKLGGADAKTDDEKRDILHKAKIAAKKEPCVIFTLQVPEELVTQDSARESSLDKSVKSDIIPEWITDYKVVTFDEYLKIFGRRAAFIRGNK